MLFIGVVGLRAQTPEPALLHRVQEVIVTPPNIVEWDVWLHNRSAQAERWANGTLWFVVRGVALRGATISVDSTALPLASAMQAASPLARTAYSIRLNVDTTRSQIALAVLGADEPEQCRLLAVRDSLMLVRVRLVAASRISRPEAVQVAWREPHERFQASAVKLSAAQPAPPLQRADNRERTLALETSASETFQPPVVDVRNFQALYGGDQRIHLRWQDSSVIQGIRANALSMGYVLRRGVRPPNAPPQMPDSVFVAALTDTVATFLRTDSLRLRRGRTARSYAVTDSVSERSARYVYHLQLVDASVRRNAAQMPPNPPQTVPVEIVSKGVTSATTRNAVISALRVSPNPAADALAVEYVIEDRVRLNVVVYDLLGNVVTTLAQNLEVPRGTATQRLQVGAWAQGVYTVVATARSVNDPTIEYSRALATFSVSK